MTYISCCSLRKGPLVKVIFILSYISGKCKEKWATFRNTWKSRRLFFAFLPFIIHCFVESEKRLLGTQNAKTPHIYPIPLEQREKTCVKFLEIGSNEHFAQNCMGSFIFRFSVYWKTDLPNIYIPYKINHNSKPVFSVSLSIRKCGRLCRVCDRHGASVRAEGTRNTFLGKEDTES